MDSTEEEVVIPYMIGDVNGVGIGFSFHYSPKSKRPMTGQQTDKAENEHYLNISHSNGIQANKLEGERGIREYIASPPVDRSSDMANKGRTREGNREEREYDWRTQTMRKAEGDSDIPQRPKFLVEPVLRTDPYNEQLIGNRQPNRDDRGREENVPSASGTQGGRSEVPQQTRQLGKGERDERGLPTKPIDGDRRRDILEAEERKGMELKPRGMDQIFKDFEHRVIEQSRDRSENPHYRRISHGTGIQPKKAGEETGYEKDERKQKDNSNLPDMKSPDMLDKRRVREENYEERKYDRREQPPQQTRQLGIGERQERGLPTRPTDGDRRRDISEAEERKGMELKPRGMDQIFKDFEHRVTEQTRDRSENLHYRRISHGTGIQPKKAGEEAGYEKDERKLKDNSNLPDKKSPDMPDKGRLRAGNYEEIKYDRRAQPMRIAVDDSDIPQRSKITLEPVPQTLPYKEQLRGERGREENIPITSGAQPGIRGVTFQTQQLTKGEGQEKGLPTKPMDDDRRRDISEAAERKGMAFKTRGMDKLYKDYERQVTGQQTDKPERSQLYANISRGTGIQPKKTGEEAGYEKGERNLKQDTSSLADKKNPDVLDKRKFREDNYEERRYDTTQQIGKTVDRNITPPSKAPRELVPQIGPDKEHLRGERGKEENIPITSGAQPGIRGVTLQTQQLTKGEGQEKGLPTKPMDDDRRRDISEAAERKGMAFKTRGMDKLYKDYERQVPGQQTDKPERSQLYANISRGTGIQPKKTGEEAGYEKGERNLKQDTSSLADKKNPDVLDKRKFREDNYEERRYDTTQQIGKTVDRNITSPSKAPRELVPQTEAQKEQFLGMKPFTKDETSKDENIPSRSPAQRGRAEVPFHTQLGKEEKQEKRLPTKLPDSDRTGVISKAEQKEDKESKRDMDRAQKDERIVLADQDKKLKEPVKVPTKYEEERKPKLDAPSAPGIDRSFMLDKRKPIEENYEERRYDRRGQPGKKTADDSYVSGKLTKEDEKDLRPQLPIVSATKADADKGQAMGKMEEGHYKDETKTPESYFDALKRRFLGIDNITQEIDKKIVREQDSSESESEDSESEDEDENQKMNMRRLQGTGKDKGENMTGAVKQQTRDVKDNRKDIISPSNLPEDKKIENSKDYESDQRKNEWREPKKGKVNVDIERRPRIQDQNTKITVPDQGGELGRKRGGDYNKPQDSGQRELQRTTMGVDTEKRQGKFEDEGKNVIPLGQTRKPIKENVNDKEISSTQIPDSRNEQTKDYRNVKGIQPREPQSSRINADTKYTRSVEDKNEKANVPNRVQELQKETVKGYNDERVVPKSQVNSDSRNYIPEIRERRPYSPVQERVNDSSKVPTKYEEDKKPKSYAPAAPGIDRTIMLDKRKPVEENYEQRRYDKIGQPGKKTADDSYVSGKPTKEDEKDLRPQLPIVSATIADADKGQAMGKMEEGHYKDETKTPESYFGTLKKRFLGIDNITQESDKKIVREKDSSKGESEDSESKDEDKNQKMNMRRLQGTAKDKGENMTGAVKQQTGDVKDNRKDIISPSNLPEDKKIENSKDYESDQRKNEWREPQKGKVNVDIERRPRIQDQNTKITVPDQGGELGRKRGGDYNKPQDSGQRELQRTTMGVDTERRPYSPIQQRVNDDSKEIRNENVPSLQGDQSNVDQFPRKQEKLGKINEMRIDNEHKKAIRINNVNVELKRNMDPGFSKELGVPGKSNAPSGMVQSGQNPKMEDQQRYGESSKQGGTSDSTEAPSTEKNAPPGGTGVVEGAENKKSGRKWGIFSRNKTKEQKSVENSGNKGESSEKDEKGTSSKQGRKWGIFGRKKDKNAQLADEQTGKVESPEDGLRPPTPPYAAYHSEQTKDVESHPGTGKRQALPSDNKNVPSGPEGTGFQLKHRDSLERMRRQRRPSKEERGLGGNVSTPEDFAGTSKQVRGRTQKTVSFVKDPIQIGVSASPGVTVPESTKAGPSPKIASDKRVNTCSCPGRLRQPGGKEPICAHCGCYLESKPKGPTVITEEDEKLGIRDYLEKVVRDKFGNQSLEIIVRPKRGAKAKEKISTRKGEAEAEEEKEEENEEDIARKGEFQLAFAKELREQAEYGGFDVTPEIMAIELRRGFRTDNMTLGGETCLYIPPEKEFEADKGDEMISFSEKDDPVEFLMKLGYSMEEATRAMRDEEVKKRMKAAMVEANVWVNRIKKPQATLLYALALKSTQKTMRYYLLLVEAIVHNRINSVTKLDSYLRLVYKVETGALRLSKALGLKDEENMGDEAKAKYEQSQTVYKRMVVKAQKECMDYFQDGLNDNQKRILQAMAEGFNARLTAHEDILARYIGRRIIKSLVVLDAAITFLSRQKGRINIEEFEKFCGFENSSEDD